MLEVHEGMHSMHKVRGGVYEVKDASLVSLNLLVPIFFRSFRSLCRFLGAALGHALCTFLAVVGGKVLATRISEKMVLISGGKEKEEQEEEARNKRAR